MRCAIIADIHSNRDALRAVLKSIEHAGVELILNVGDTFGYYAWPMEVYDLLQTLTVRTVLGNHDRMVLDGTCPSPVPFYWPAIAHNRAALTPAAWAWLRSLPQEINFNSENAAMRVVHGTPDDPLEGRLYPDRPRADLPWLPKHGEVLVLGHTHYPMIVKTALGGLLINPGSVGQPRDGNPQPCWVLLDTRRFTASLIRVKYDWESTVRELRALKWHEQAIWALNKVAA